MNRWPAVLAVLILLPAAAAVSWMDASGDQRLGRPTHYEDAEPQYQWFDADGASWYGNVDLVSASIEETAADLVFTIEVAGEGDDPPPVPGGPSFDEFVHGFSFQFREREYLVGFTQGFFGGGDLMISLLSRFDVFGQELYFPSFHAAPATVQGSGWTGVLPKAVFRDENLVPLREGDHLEKISLFASNNDISFGGPTDFCPDVPGQPTDPPGFAYCAWVVRDEATDLGSLEVKVTPPGVGHLFLRIPEPYRMSNGLATTYLFEADLRNLEEVEDTVTLQVSDVPKDWEVRLPSSVRFSGKGDGSVPVAVTVPFSHVHGQSHFMTLSAVSRLNASAIVETGFGVIFADPPQPAGHHDTLYFHGEDFCPPDFGFSCAQAYMNAEPDPAEPRYSNGRFVNEVDGYPPYYDFSDPDQATLPAVRTWDIPLSPQLGIGVDFDVSKRGTLTTALRFDEAWAGDVEATLLLRSYGQDRVTHRTLAAGITQGVDFPAGQAVSVDVELGVDPAADIIHFSQGQNLVLYVNVTDTTGTPWQLRYGDAWMVMDETQMLLPLLDYHEPVDLSGLRFADLQIERLNQTLKYVNPGKTTLFVFNVTNIGTRQATMDWEVAGPERFAAWARVAPAATHLAPGGNGTVVVRIAPPADAVEGDVAELLLVGTMRQDPATQLFGRLVAAVTTQDEIPDEAGAADMLEGAAKKANDANQKDSPAPPMLVAVALAVAVVARRRN